MPLFTTENAAILGRRGAEARWRKPQPAANPPPIAQPLAVEDYTALRLVCVREQLGQVDRAILLEAGKDHPDGQRLNWLAQAQDRLSEQERKLAGRPLPGSRRPKDYDRTPAGPGAYRVYDDSPPVPAKPVVPEVDKVEPEQPRPQFPEGGCP